MNIDGSTVWITGGTSGIGKATAKLLVEKGARVMITGRNAEKGQAAQEEIGDNCVFMKADITDTQANMHVCEQLIAKWGKLDIHFANAGFPHLFSVFDDKGELNPIDPYVADIKVNLIGAYDTARIASYHMKKNEPDEHGERGNLIFTASLAAPASNAGDALFGYKSAKEGVSGLARQFAGLLAPYGIRVNSVCPGWIKTGMTEGADTNPGIDLTKPIPFQLFPPTVGDPKSIAQTVVYFIENEFINRAEVSVDAGYLLRR